MTVTAPYPQPRVDDFRITLSEMRWRDLAHAPPGEYIGHWCNDDHAFALFWVGRKPTIFSTPLINQRYFALSCTTRAASVAERLGQDLWGAIPLDAFSTDPILDHDKWLSIWPMSRRALPASPSDPQALRIASPRAHAAPPSDRHQVPVSEVGRAHRGLLKSFIGKSVSEAVLSMGRIAAGEAVSGPLTLATALEKSLDVAVSAPTRDGRLILLEVERVIAHLGSMARIAYGAGHELLATHLLLAKKSCEDACLEHTGSHLMLDSLILGGLATRVAPKALAYAVLSYLTPRLDTLEKLFPTVASELTGRATVPPDRADLWLLNGVNGRASGRRNDLRPSLSDARNRFSEQFTTPQGDACSRMRRRFLEMRESLAYIHAIVSAFGADVTLSSPTMACGDEALSVIEGARGESWIWVRCADERITHMHMQTGSLNVMPVFLELTASGEDPDFVKASLDYSPSSAEL